jgi:hypothetical protein
MPYLVRQLSALAEVDATVVGESICTLSLLSQTHP